MRYKIKYFLIFSFSLLLSTIWYTYHILRVRNTPSTEPITEDQQLSYACCTPLNHSEPRNNIFYLKIQRTGGSTLQNILFRFAERNSLNIMFPKPELYLLPFSFLSLQLHTSTLDNKYNLLTHTIRYTPLLQSYQHPATVMVTMLRHPATFFRSVYNHFGQQISTGQTFGEFIANPKPLSSIGIINRHIAYRGFNKMSYELGFNGPPNDKKSINDFISDLDREFHFVMITEFFDESLVLLANLMGWPLEYVTYVYQNHAPSRKYDRELSEKDIKILSTLNNVDAILYRHFLNKFQICVRQYGLERLKNQVSQLRHLNQQLAAECATKRSFHAYYTSSRSVFNNSTDLKCDRIATPEATYDKLLQNQQAKRIQKIREFQFVDNMKVSWHNSYHKIAIENVVEGY